MVHWIIYIKNSIRNFRGFISRKRITFLPILVYFLVFSPFVALGQNNQLNDVTKQPTLINLIKVYAAKHQLKPVYDAEKVKQCSPSQTLVSDFAKENSKVNLDQLLLFCGLKAEKLGESLIIKPIEDYADHKAKKDLGLISGVILDADRNESLPFAFVQLKGTKQSSISNQDGYFTLIPTEGKDHQIWVSYLGYENALVNLDKLEKTPKGLYIIKLNKSVTILEGVDFEGNKKPEIFESNTLDNSFSINPALGEKLPSLGNQDPMNVLHFLPGVSVSENGSAGLNVRGAKSEYNLFIHDGLNLFRVDHFFGLFSALNHHVIKNLRLYKNSVEARYGGRTSSVIEVIGKNGDRNQNNYAVGLNMISGDIYSELKLGKKVNFIFAGRRSFTDLFQNKFYDQIFSQSINNNFTPRNLGFVSTPLESPLYNFYDINTKLTYYPNDKNIITMTLYNGQDRIKLVSDITNEEQENYQFEQRDDWGNTGFSLKWGKTISQKWYSTVSFATTNYFVNRNNREEIFIPNLRVDNLPTIEKTTAENNNRNSIFDNRITWHNEFLRKEEHKIEIGISANVSGYRVDLFESLNDETKNEVLIDNEGVTFSGYLQYDFPILKKTKLKVGLRTQHQDLVDDFFLEPRLSLTQKLNEIVELRGGYSRNNQFVNIVDFDPFDSLDPGILFISDGKDIPVVTSDAIYTGAQFKKKNWLVDAEMYYRMLTGKSFFLSSEFSNSSVGPFFNGDSQSIGLDLLIQYKSKIYNGWLGYSWMSVYDQFEGLNQNKRFRPQEDRRHQIQIVNSVNLKNWDLSLTFVASSGMPFSRPNNAITDQELNQSLLNTERTPIFHRMDTSLSYTFKSEKLKAAQLGISVYNLYNQTNIKFRKFTKKPSSAQGSNDPFIANEVFYLGFTPNLFLNFKF